MRRIMTRCGTFCFSASTKSHSQIIHNSSHQRCYRLANVACGKHTGVDSHMAGVPTCQSVSGNNTAQFRNSEGSSSSSHTKIWNSLLGAGLVSALLGAHRYFDVALNEDVQHGDSASESFREGSSSDSIVDNEKIMEHAKRGIEERLKFGNLSSSALPPFEIAAKGQQVAIRFPVSPVCDIWLVVVNVVSRMGHSSHGSNGEKIVVSASKSAVALSLTMEHPEQISLPEELQEGTKRQAGNTVRVWVFEPLIGGKFPEVEFLKRGYFSREELDMVASTLYLASGVGEDSALSRYRKEHVDKTPEQNGKRSTERKDSAGSMEKILGPLEAMGVKVYGLETGSSINEISWESISGYHEQKREIEDTVLLALRRPDIYDSIARGTRHKFESNRPRAVLFEGPPGTGKTSCARVIATQSGVPLLYVPVEVVMSKYYGESERMLGRVFDAANKLPGGAIIFLDEIDSLATIRDGEMHEATRRLLSVLLRQIDGFEQDTRVVVVAATNRKEDLDPALISRFDISVTFGLPDKHTREEIVVQYARHLSSSEVASLAAVTEGMSGRDLRDICEQAERHWASKLIRGMAGNPSTHGLPPIQEYIECAVKRRDTSQTWPDKQWKGGRPTKDGKKGWPSVVV